MKIHTIGGFNEVGKNMTVIELQDDAIILDSGLYLPAVVELQEAEQEQTAYTEKRLRGIGALPDDLLLDKLGIRNKVRAILIGHAHLDHVGAIPYMSYRYNAPLVGTFYRAASPDSSPFVDIGDIVEPKQTLCIIEAMKVMNEITAEYKGKILEIFPENGEMVEYGKPLLKIQLIED